MHGSANVPERKVRAKVIRRDAKNASKVAVLVLDSKNDSSSQLLVHEGERQAIERKLRIAFGGPATLSITNNSEQLLRFEVKEGVLHARVHHMFLGAPSRVLDALVGFGVNDDQQADTLIGNYIETNKSQIVPAKRAMRTKGRYHDLAKIYEDVNKKYFSGTLEAPITWGQERYGRKAKRQVRLGSYNRYSRVIRINPTLDRSWIPRYFVAYIVFHEMLHHKTQIMTHPAEFVALEKTFKAYEKAREWERKHIARLLRS